MRMCWNSTNTLKFSPSLCILSSVNYIDFNKCVPNANHIPGLGNAVTSHNLPPQQNSSHFHQLSCDFWKRLLWLCLLTVGNPSEDGLGTLIEILVTPPTPFVYSSTLNAHGLRVWLSHRDARIHSALAEEVNWWGFYLPSYGKVIIHHGWSLSSVTILVPPTLLLAAPHLFLVK